MSLIIKLFFCNVLFTVLVLQKILLSGSSIVNSSQIECGYIDFKGSLGIEQIIKGSPIFEEKFESIYRNLSDASIYITNENCFIEICGHRTVLHKGERAIEPICSQFTETTLTLPKSQYSSDFEATSIQCGCKDSGRYPECTTETCGSKPLINDTTICAVLYQEKGCKECSFNGIILSKDGEYKTGTSAVIRSAYIQPECQLNETAFGYSVYDPPDFPTQNFIPFSIIHNGDSNGTRLKPIHTRRGEYFSCTCPKLKNVSNDTTDQSVLSAESKWGLGAVGVIFVLGCIILITYIAKRCLLSNHKRVIDKEAIIRFVNGTNKKCSIADAAPGVSEAVCSPFNKSLLISRDRIYFNPKNPDSVLGQGTFGIVFQGTYRPSNKEPKISVAIKTLRPYSTDDYTKSILNEVKVLAYVGKHPNILSLIGACITDEGRGEVYVVLELCKNGSLKNYLEALKNELTPGSQQSRPEMNLQPDPDHPDYLLEIYPVAPVDKPKPPELCQSWINQFFVWSKEIATGMQFLAEKGVLHVDLGVRNILLTKELVSKIGDFGLSRKLYDKSNYLKKTNEPVPFKVNALESLRYNNYSVKSDVWAYGVTLWEIFSLSGDPYPDLGYVEIINFLTSGQRLKCPTYAPYEVYKQSMLKCWNMEVEERPSFSEMREYFDNILKNYAHEVLNN